MIGTRAMSGSAAIRLRNVVIASSPSIMPSSMLTSRMLAPPLDLLARDCERPLVVARLDQAGELLRAGDVGALADHDEVGLGRIDQRLDAAADGDAVGRRRARAARAPSTASAIARMCSGVVPQQPPTRFSQPLRANSPSDRRRLLGRLVEAAEAVGQAGVRVAAHEGRRGRARAPRRTGRISSTPSAQFMPTASGRACETEYQNASTVCPESVRPLRRRSCTESDHRHAAPARRRRSSRSRRGRPSGSACRRWSRRGGGRRRRRRGRGSARRRRRPARRSRRRGTPGSSTSGEIESGPVRRADRAGDEARPVGRPRGHLVGGPARDLGGGQVDLADRALEPVVGQRDRRSR